MAATTPSTSQRRGVWEPLPLLLYGYAVHPVAPSRRDTRISGRTRFSSVTSASATDDRFVDRDVLALEVGDEVYAFEKYTPRGKEVDGVWYRGYLVDTTRRPNVNWPSPSDPTSASKAAKQDGGQVLVGIFPASHIHIRGEVADGDGRISSLNRPQQTNGNGAHSEPPSATSSRGKGKMPDRRGQDEESHDPSARGKYSGTSTPTELTITSSSRAGFPPYQSGSRSRSSSMTDGGANKPLPPPLVPSSGDDSKSGAEQPIVDEIASAMREWHTLMFQHLARRDYPLFHTVRDHIEALHIGRRQLLADTLSVDEMFALRRDCVSRLVSGNIAQGLDVIVRHPSWGGLITVDVDGEIDRRSWMSAVRMYALQMSLAYLETPPDTGMPGSRASGDLGLSGPTPTPAHSSFPDLLLSKGSSLSSFGPSPFRPTHRHTSSIAPANVKPAKFFHVFLELRAFVASLCSPGETAELFFSLYHKGELRFITEEFCAILNHNGVLARDPTAKICTLFTDLVQSDVQDPIFLVCRIVRNGALKLGNNVGSGSPTSELGRRVSSSSVREAPGFPRGGWESPGLNGQMNGGDTSSHVRRPFGCAVLELTQLSAMATEGSEMSSMKEHSMPIFVSTNEAVFSMIHQDIIANNAKEFEKSSRAEALAISVKIFHGDAPTIVRENMSLLQGAPLTLRLGFPDVVFPGDVRNELYIKLWSGDFSQSHTGSARMSVANFARGQIGGGGSNVMVTIEVRDQTGRRVPNAITMGSGEPPVERFQSMVFTRNPQPTYGELVKVALPMMGNPNWHLYFTFHNRGARDSRPSTAGRGAQDPTERPFAFAYLPLFPQDRAFLEDGSHTLVLYRADRGPQLTADVYLGATPWLGNGQRAEQITMPAEMQKVTAPMRDTVTLRSSLCSTRFTQNPVLLSLLSWQQITDQGTLSTILTKFTFVGEMEIVKFLRDIFDSLFGILVAPANQGGEMDQLVFNALVTVLRIVQDRRFRNFQPVLDVYIERHFNNAAASSHMIQSMNRLLANPSAPETAAPLRAALRVWHYIFKFIARSRELQKAKELSVGGGATAEALEATFRREVRTHLAEVNKMMAMTAPPAIIGTQTMALQHFTLILPELAKIFPTVELVTFATTFANSLGAAKGKLIIWKLIMYLQLVKGFLFDNAQARSLLVEAVGIWIKPHFGRFDFYAHTQPGDPESAVETARVSWLESARLCVTITAVMLDKLQTNLVDPAIIADKTLFRQEQDNVEYLLPLLPRLLASYLEFQSPASQQAIDRSRSFAASASAVPVAFPESYPFSLLAYLPAGSSSSTPGSPLGKDAKAFVPAMGETAIVFLALMLASSKKHILNFLEESYEIEGLDFCVTLLSQIFRISVGILENEAFPSNWLNVNILAPKVLVKLMDPIATVLVKRFIPDPQSNTPFNEQTWKEALYVLMKLLSSPLLVIEDLTSQKRRAVWRLAGDVRGEGAALLLRLWDALGWPEEVAADSGAVTRFGGYQVAMNSLVGHVVNLCLSHHEQLRNNAVHILYSMIVSEYHHSEQFHDIENEVVNKLDSLFMGEGKTDELSKTYFIGQLRQLFDASQVDERLRERVAIFLDSVDMFLDLLLNIRALPEGEEFADDRVIATLRLMNFIRREGRDEMYIKYVHQLVNMHLQSHNYVEAALTLKLHSDLHEWDLHNFVPPMDDLGLPQQSHFHRKETLCLLIMDYLGKGKAWENAIDICKDLAFQHEENTFNYARLSEILRHQATLLERIVTEQRYYPDYFKVTYFGSFPAAIRNKTIVFRGFEWEKFGAFCERMLSKHPGARLLKTVGSPSVDIRFGTDQYIQCAAVAPEPNRDHAIFANPDVPTQVRAYYEHTGTNVFSSVCPVVKVGRDGAEETWVEKTYYTTEYSFPTVLRRSEVLSVEVVEISPIENAITEVRQRTQELESLYIRYSAVAKTAQVVSTNALSMTLNDAVDSPNEDGVPAIRAVFLDREYLQRYPDRANQIADLRKAIDGYTRTIDSCIRLHGQMCPPEMIPFHETLERFFRRNFAEEISRMAGDGLSVLTYPDSIAPSNFGSNSQYHTAIADHQSAKVSASSGSTRRAPYALPALQLGRPTLTPPPPTPTTQRGSQHDSVDADSVGALPKITPLKRHLAHLARHGMNGVSSSPERGTSDVQSLGSPTDNVIELGSKAPSIHSVAATKPAPPAPTHTTSTFGRLSRFGSLRLRR